LEACPDARKGEIRRLFVIRLHPQCVFVSADGFPGRSKSKRQKNLLTGLFAAVILLSLAMAAQQMEDPKYTFNFGAGPGFPQGRVSDFSNTGANIVAGAGMNLGKSLGVNSEFMWHNLPPKDSVIAATGAPDGHAGLYSVTGNLIFKTPPRKLGGYAIGGIGWYHRNWALTAPTLSIGTVCAPTYVWWGVTCFNGLVESTATLQSGSSDAFGWNGGGGVTFRIGESAAKFYTEVRYHQASNKGITTKVLPLTFGIRW
jgi:Outer membrane protein beta-barrel domain